MGSARTVEARRKDTDHAAHTTQTEHAAEHAGQAYDADHAIEVGASDDAYEAQADRAADAAVRRLEQGGQLGSSAAFGAVRHPDAIGAGGGAASAEVSQRISDARGGGNALPADLRRSMEGAFGGASFSGVRLHSGPEAADLSAQVGAHAFTVGKDVFLGASLPGLDTREGQHTLAHELAHTLQPEGAAHRAVARRKGSKGRTGTKSLDSFGGQDYSKAEKAESTLVSDGASAVGDSFGSPSAISDANDYRDDLYDKTGKVGSDADGDNITYASPAFATFGLAVNAAAAVKVFQDGGDWKEKSEAIMGLGGGMLGLATSVSSTVKAGEGGDTASAATKAADSILGEIAGVIGAIKSAWDMVFTIAELIDGAGDMETSEKAFGAMEAIKTALEVGKGIAETVKKFMDHLGTATTAAIQAAPAIGIAINVVDIIMQGINAGYSYVSMVEMRADKRESKERVLGRKALMSKGLAGVFGGHESAETQSRAIIEKVGGRRDKGETLTDAEHEKLGHAEDYQLSKNLQTIAQKRINRAVLLITTDAVSIAGDIATLSGVGAAVGGGLKAGAAGLQGGAALLRTGKQMYHNAMGTDKSMDAKHKRYDGMVRGITLHIDQANSFPVPAVTDRSDVKQVQAENAAVATREKLRDKALREVIASGMTPAKMNAHLPKAQAKATKGKIAPDSTVTKEAGRTLYGEWVQAMKKR